MEEFPAGALTDAGLEDLSALVGWEEKDAAARSVLAGLTGQQAVPPAK